LKRFNQVKYDDSLLSDEARVARSNLEFVQSKECEHMDLLRNKLAVNSGSLNAHKIALEPHFESLLRGTRTPGRAS